MNRPAEPGIEVATRPDEHKYYVEKRDAKYPVSGQPGQSRHNFEAKSPGRSTFIWVVTIITIVCLAVALGVGLGVGLAAQHRSESPG